MSFLMFDFLIGIWPLSFFEVQFLISTDKTGFPLPDRDVRIASLTLSGCFEHSNNSDPIAIIDSSTLFNDIIL